MATRRVKLTFPSDLITEPLIYELGKKFEIISNIRRADVRESIGWVVLELKGDESEIDSGVEWMRLAGVRVDPISEAKRIIRCNKGRFITGHAYSLIIRLFRSILCVFIRAVSIINLLNCSLLIVFLL